MGMGYSVGHSTPSGLNVTLIVLNSTTAVRATIVEFSIGSTTIADSSDYAIKYNLLRHTAAQTGGTALVEQEHDEDEVAASCPAVGGTMTEPSYEADELYNFAANQTVSFLWTARPGKGYKTTLGTANGIGLRSILSTAVFQPTIDATLSWEE